MDEENVQAQDEIVEQEEQISEESTQEETPQEEDSVTLNKAEYKKLKRQSFAYEASKKPKEEAKVSESSSLSYEALFAVKDISKDEFDALKDEAEDLGVPVEKYLKTESSKVFLKNLQNKKKSADSNVALNSKSPVFKKYTQDDLSKMSVADLEKILPRD